MKVVSVHIFKLERFTSELLH